MQRKIIHIDADCFYAAIEMRDRPDLRGIPMAVGGSAERRGVLSQFANNGLLTTVCCALRVRALPSAIACSLIFRISSTLPTYRGVTLLDRPAALRPRAGLNKLVW